MSDAFILSAMEIDGVSVGREDDHIVVTCREYDHVGEIDAEPVHELIWEHDLRVQSTVADFDAGELRIEVVA